MFKSDCNMVVGLDQRTIDAFIPDFSEWTQQGMFEEEFKKLCRDLGQEGVPMRKEDK